MCFRYTSAFSAHASRPSFADHVPSEMGEGAGKAGWPQHPGLHAQKKFARAREPQVRR
jgi:hypothetical protein